jgi:phosphoglycerol transferase MdoB-like AlkP superfamily enzyme
MKGNSLKSYLDILKIRHRAAHRNMLLTGTIFILSLLAFFAFGMLGRLENLALYLISPILVAFAFGFISFRIKYETTKALIELCIELVQDGGAS